MENEVAFRVKLMRPGKKHRYVVVQGAASDMPKVGEGCNIHGDGVWMVIAIEPTEIILRVPTPNAAMETR